MQRFSDIAGSARRTRPPAFTADRASPSIVSRWFRRRERRSVHLPGIGPGRPSGHEINLLKNVTHDLIGLVLFAELIELGHHSCERSFHIADRALGVILPLRVETALATNEFFSVEIGKGMEGPDRKAEANLSGSGTNGSSTLASPPVLRKV